jgi:hypothetical protein
MAQLHNIKTKEVGDTLEASTLHLYGVTRDLP